MGGLSAAFPGLARRVADFDPRLKLGLAFAAGVLVWRTGPAGTVLYLAASLFLFWLLKSRLPSMVGAGRAYAVFVLLWAGLKAGGDAWSGAPLDQALAGGGMLGLRLAVLVFLGLALAASASARQLGLAVSWATAPVLRGGAWQAGLAVGLCIHYLPLVWQTAGDARRCADMRLARRGRLPRLGAALKATVRTLGARTESHALAVALRNMDGPEAWRCPFKLSGGQAASAGLALALLLGAAVL